MASKPDTTDAMNKGPASILRLGQERTDAMLTMHRELLEAYEQASRAWLERVRSEADFWSQLTSRLTATRSVPDALDTYQQSIAQRIAMATDDGRRLVEEYQRMMTRIAQTMANAKPTGST